MTILMVDPVDNIRVTLASMLKELGFKNIIQARDGRDALQAIENNSANVDVIISDFNLPKLDGIELLREIRKHPKLGRIPFLMLSAHIEQSEVIRAIKNGVSEYVVKPFSINILKQRLSQAIKTPIKSSATLLTQSANKSAASEAKDEKPKTTILIVDDVPDNIHLLADILRGDYQVKGVTSAKKAIELCRSDKAPDLLLLDIMMPEMDGLQLCRQLKRDPLTQHITVIFISALDQNEKVVEGLELGAVDYITKPIVPAITKARIKNHAAGIAHLKSLRVQVDTFIENVQLRDEFDRLMQHSLKSPLLQMNVTIDDIAKSSRHPNRVEKLSHNLAFNCNSLVQLVDNMTTLYKLEDGSYQISPTVLDLSTIVDDVVASFTSANEAKQLEISIEGEGKQPIFAEQFLTFALVSHLFKNAIEAAPSGSAVNILLEKSANVSLLKITNVGEIPDEIRASFMDKYVSFGKKDGAGIGCYAAKLMVELQQGKIAFELNGDGLTHVLVELPSV